jgi:hypothetical protein
MEPEVMDFNDFMAFIADSDYLLPENHKLMPLASLASPYFTVWVVSNEVIIDMRRRVQ